MNRQHGVTLIELVISLVIIGVGLASIILAFGTAGVAAARPDRTVQAVAIAEAYLEEISLQPFSDPDGVAEGSRDLFDDIFDYHGLSESPPRDQDDVALPGLAAYQVDVSVLNTAALGPGGTQVPIAAAARIDVRVRRGTEIDITLTSHRTDY